MGALLAPLLGIVGSLSVQQWLAVAGGLFNAAPHVKEAWQAAHPAIDLLVQKIEEKIASGLPVDQSLVGAAQDVHEFCARNADAAIALQGDAG